jgi:hypothetical protein
MKEDFNPTRFAWNTAVGATNLGYRI